MTAPKFADCGRCGHAHAYHPAADAGMCTVPHCQCLNYRPPRSTMTATAPVRPVVVTTANSSTPPGDMEGMLLAAGKASPFKRTSALADKIEALLVELRGRLADEEKTAGARATIARLERELADAKAALRKNTGSPAKPAAKPAPKPAPSGETTPCPDCGDLFAKQGMGPHRAMKHGYRRPA